MTCDFCTPMDAARAYAPQHYCGACDLFCLAELPAPTLRTALEDQTLQVRVWLEVMMQTPHSYSMGILLRGRPPRPKHRGLFSLIDKVTEAKIVATYAPYAAEARDIADQQVAQLRGFQGQRLVPLPAGARARIGYGTRGENMDASIQMGYISPLGIRYELTWFHIGTIVAARIHCYPEGRSALEG